MQLQETVSESTGQHLTTTVQTWRILSGEKHKVRMWVDNFLGFRNEKFPVIIQKTIQGFQDIRWSQVQFIKNQPVALSQGLD
ncbi:hypothetical protein WICPIJ_003149 [Wickerhamomyces pijperi]|uniref:Uncharacterized protein n=1 Tax=Wickerhamomyces pijperi TaxID=599730 RepID=A0A9P8TNY8_WICPI|nr:hypothetical protein WICPIJ_003149 [Wickerhamomyces pijperi]